MPDLLLELGCEELPASFVRRAMHDLAQRVQSALTEAGLSFGAAEVYSTPRRLIVGLAGIQDRQPDSVKESRGPALAAAFDASGAPTKALEGFCRGQGVSPSEVERREDYVWVKKAVPGRSAHEILAEALPGVITGLTFDKTMRWGGGKLRFARPIRWILAALDGQVIPFEVGPVKSGLESRGHRFYAPQTFTATTLNDLVIQLRAHKVEPDPAVRERMIRDGAAQVATGTPELNPDLVDENVFLTEWPTPVEGQFPESYLNLPEPVLITAMAKHERMFPVRQANGSLANRFVAVRNAGEDDTVRAGNAWVLNARFNDAKFFFDEDEKSTLDDFLARTERMLFQDKLGTVRARADRLAALARSVAKRTGLTEAEQDAAELAGFYAKADLSTGLVAELSSLQGVVGGLYARREGRASAVCEALGAQYRPVAAESVATEGGRVAACLIVADQIDKLAGFLGLGLAPKGSSDPFGLRRAATVLIDAAWAWPALRIGFAELFAEADGLYRGQGVALDADGARAIAADVFRGRYDALMEDVRHDVLNAALADRAESDILNPRGMRLRVDIVTHLAGNEAFVTAISRPANIVDAATKKGDAIADALDAGVLGSAEGVALAGAVDAAQAAIQAGWSAEDAAAVASALAGLTPTIDAYFTATMVNDPDAAVRAQRLGVARRAADSARQIADFRQLVG